MERKTITRKSARGQPLDFVVGDLPVKIITDSSAKVGSHTQGLQAAMKKLGSAQGLLAAPIETSDPGKAKGLRRVSWLHFTG